MKNQRILPQALSACLFTITFATAASEAAPVITGVNGKLQDGSTLVISGKEFTAKKNASPLFWWKADMGVTPSNLGRKSSWDGTFNGDLTTEKAAPNSQQAVRFDHGQSSGAALGIVYFSSNQAFVHRKLYEDFDITKDFAIRSRISSLNGTFKVGQVVTGASSGATAVVQKATSDALWFSQSGGSINKKPAKDFVYGEKISSATGSAVISEGSDKYPNGVSRTFNYKTIRFWNGDYKNNIHMNAQGVDGNGYRTTAEYTDGTLWPGLKGSANPLRQSPRVWQHQDVYYKASDLNVANGIWRVDVDGVPSWTKTFITRTSDRPDPYNQIFQSQVSNGAQIGSYVYYDSLYIDDTWHHVALCSSPRWSECSDKEMQIPTKWSDTSITIQVNEGSLNFDNSLYLYVVDKDGNANVNGFALAGGNPPVAQIHKVSD